MQLKYRLPFVLISSLILAATVMHGQEDDEDEEEFGAFGFYSSAPKSIKLSLNMTQGPQVNFGNLGNIDIPDRTGPGVTSRTYMDGQVSDDALRPYNPTNPPLSELDRENQRLYPSGGRYKTYSTPGDPTSPLVTDYLGYRPGYTRNWGYNNASQAVTIGGSNYIAFDIYRALTKGPAESEVGSRGYTGGVQLSLTRNLTDVKKRVSFSLTAGLSLTGINSSKAGKVTSTMHTSTDYYLYQPYGGTGAPVLPNNADGSVPNPIYTGPSFDSTTTPGRTVETTTTVSANPDLHIEDPNGIQDVEVDGNWKIKGAYFTLKFGPQINAMVTRSLGLSASAGVAGSYVSTTYSVNESFSVAGVTQLISRGEEATVANKLLPGYYANLDATWTINDRAGFFAGVSYDNLGDYTQRVAGRTARIDLSATAGIRGGLTIKF